MGPLARAAAAAAATLAAAGCASHYAGPKQHAEIAFSNRITVPARGPSMLVSLRLANRGREPVLVRSVTPPAGDGLDVDYLGYTDCSHGCPGGEIDNPDAFADVTRSVMGVSGFRIPPETDTSAAPVYLMFRATARNALPGPQGCLAAGAAVLRLDDGTAVEVAFQGSWSMGLVGLGRNRSACDRSAGHVKQRTAT